MGYREDVAELVASRREELEADLRAAKLVAENFRRELTEAEQRVASFEALLSFDASTVREGEVPIGHVTLHVAMQTVLRDAPGQRMRPAELAAAIHARGLYRMRDGRPVEAQQIHARVGNYDDLFDRDGTFITLK
jgi:hypothetical protein